MEYIFDVGGNLTLLGLVFLFLKYVFPILLLIGLGYFIYRASIRLIKETRISPGDVTTIIVLLILLVVLLS